MDVEFKILDSGLTLLHDQMDVHSTSVGVYIGSGSSQEAKNECGIAHMLEHMAFKGTENRNATYEVGTGQGYKVSDIVKHAGYDVPTQEGQDAEADDNTADNTELKKLGWKTTLKPTEWIDIKIAIKYTNSVT